MRLQKLNGGGQSFMQALLVNKWSARRQMDTYDCRAVDSILRFDSSNFLSAQSQKSIPSRMNVESS